MNHSLYINFLNDKLKESINLFNKYTLPLSIELLNLEKNPKKWTAGQLLAHINITNRLYIDAILKKRDEKGFLILKDKTVEVKHGLIGNWFNNMMLNKRKVTTTKVFMPLKKEYGNSEKDIFIAIQSEFGKLLLEANNWDLVKNKLTSPALKILKFRLADAFSLLIFHQIRHLEQIRNMHPKL